MRGWHGWGWRLSRVLMADGHCLEHLLADVELEMLARHGHAVLLEHLGVRDVHDAAQVHAELNEELVEGAAKLGHGLADVLHRHADGVDESLDGGLDVVRALDLRVVAPGTDLEHGAGGLLLGGHFGVVVLLGGELVYRLIARDLERLPFEREDELDNLHRRVDDESFQGVDVRDAGLLDDVVFRDLRGEWQRAFRRTGNVEDDGVSRSFVVCSGLRDVRDLEPGTAFLGELYVLQGDGDDGVGGHDGVGGSWWHCSSCFWGLCGWREFFFRGGFRPWLLFCE